MNNKGQTLILFVILLPILLVFLTLLIQFGLLTIERKKIDRSMLECTEYGLLHIDDENIENDVKKCLNKNISNQTNKVIIENKVIYVTLHKKLNDFQELLNKNDRIIEIQYKGYYENDEIKIDRG